MNYQTIPVSGLIDLTGILSIDETRVPSVTITATTAGKPTTDLAHMAEVVEVMTGKNPELTFVKQWNETSNEYAVTPRVIATHLCDAAQALLGEGALVTSAMNHQNRLSVTLFRTQAEATAPGIDVAATQAAVLVASTTVQYFFEQKGYQYAITNCTKETNVQDGTYSLIIKRTHSYE